MKTGVNHNVRASCAGVYRFGAGDGRHCGHGTGAGPAQAGPAGRRDLRPARLRGW